MCAAIGRNIVCTRKQHPDLKAPNNRPLMFVFDTVDCKLGKIQKKKVNLIFEMGLMLIGT